MDKSGLLIDALGLTLAITLVGVGGWLLQTWLRIKHGYPLVGEIDSLGIDKGGNA